jgi:tetratricopeptide (TPR) repeat protein
MGRPKEAALHLREADRIRPSDRPTLYNLQKALRRDGQIEEAGRVLASFSELSKRNSKIGETSLAAVQLNNAGVESEKKGDVSTALEKYRAALDLEPGHEGFRVNHGLALCRLGRWEEGIAEIREVVQQNPENAEASRDLFIAVDHLNALAKTQSIPRSEAPK